MAQTETGTSGLLAANANADGVPTRSRRVTVPSAQDLEIAKQDALLQLKIGRSAHYFIVLVSVALLIDAVLVLVVQPTLAGIEPTRLQSVYYLFLPMVGGVYLSFFSLRLKWEDFQVWPWERHFLMTIGAVILNVLLVYLLVASLIGYGPTAAWDLASWFYPLALLAITVPMVALAMTWPSWPRAKLYSIGCAAIPVSFGLVTIFPPASAAAATNALAVTLFAAAFLYQTSGSFLHLMSSGTKPHEQAVMVAGQSRMFQLAEDVRRREDGLRAREVELARRESAVEISEASLARHKEAVTQARQQLDDIETEFQQRSEALSKGQLEWAAKSGEVSALAKALQDREEALVFREQEVERRSPQILDREQRMQAKEAEIVQAAAMLQQKSDEVGRQAQQLQDNQARTETRRQELEKKSLQLLQQESEVRTRIAVIGAPSNIPDNLAARTKDLESREAKLGQLKLVLDEQNTLLGRKARETETQLTEIRQRSQSVAQREASLAQREMALKAREGEIDTRTSSAVDKVRLAQEQSKRYESRLAELEKREADLNVRRSEYDRTNTTLTQREVTIKDSKAQMATERSIFEQSLRTLLEQQKALEFREADLKVREAALEGLPDYSEDETPSSKHAAPRGKAGMALFAATPAVAAGAVGTMIPSLTAEPPPNGSGRASSGIRRLDQLLQGGLPPKGHVLLIGPPFVGKELLLYSFVSEGLNRGEAMVIVTAARPPEEVVATLRKMHPDYDGFDKAGKIVWIDATGSTPSNGSKASDGKRVGVKGPNDHAAILSALVAAMRRFETQHVTGVRVGFLGLAASLAGADPDAGFRFLQNFVGILKPRDALAMYTIDNGSLAPAQVASLQSRMDGAIEFQTERGRNYLAVRGLGEVATREWVEYRATDHSVTIGSFALERIR